MTKPMGVEEILEQVFNDCLKYKEVSYPSLKDKKLALKQLIMGCVPRYECNCAKHTGGCFNCIRNEAINQLHSNLERIFQ